MKDGLKKLITKYGGTYTQYDNTTYDLLIQLCSALNLPYDKYMDEDELFTLIAERGIVPGSGGESGGNEGEGETLTWDDVIPTYYLSSTDLRSYTTSDKAYTYYYYGTYSYGTGLYCLDNTTRLITYYPNYYNYLFFTNTTTGDLYAYCSEYINGTTIYHTIHIYGNVITYLGKIQAQYRYIATNGDMYVASNTSSSTGILYIRGSTAEFITDTGYNWSRFYEDSYGYIYISSISGSYGLLCTKNGDTHTIYSTGIYYIIQCDSSNNIYISATNSSYLKGLVHYNVSTKIITPLLTDGYSFSGFFESSLGDVYISGVSGGDVRGLYWVDGTYIEQIHSYAHSWGNFYEETPHDIYCCINYPNRGLYHIDGKTVTQLSDTGQSCDVYWKDSKGRLYLGQSTSRNYSSLFFIEGKSATLLWDKGYFNNFFESKDGHIYAGTDDLANNYGLLYIDGNTPALQILDTYSWGNFTYMPNGELYVHPGTKDGYALRYAKLEGSTATIIYDVEQSGYFSYTFIASDGTIYAGSSGSSSGAVRGIYALNSGVATHLITTGYSWKYFFEDSKGNVYVTADHEYSSSNYVYMLTPTAAIKIYQKPSGYAPYKYFHEDETGQVWLCPTVDFNKSSYIVKLNIINKTGTMYRPV